MARARRAKKVDETLRRSARCPGEVCHTVQYERGAAMAWCRIIRRRRRRRQQRRHARCLVCESVRDSERRRHARDFRTSNITTSWFRLL
jgi:hypothetical protein